MRRTSDSFLSLVAVLFGLFLVATATADEEQKKNSLKLLQVTSSYDQTEQPSLVWHPEKMDEPRPLFVFLHSWSGNYKQDNSKWLKLAVKKDWIYLHPNFRGRNDSPLACGSAAARQDILDAIQWVTENLSVDCQRIYLAGSSGGGHMSMLMAGHHPDRFSAVSAWVGISDLAEWYRFHSRTGVEKNYAKMIVKSLGAPPGKDPVIDEQYQDRSPLFHLHQVGDLPLDLNAGIHDGYSGSVPTTHTLRAFNVVASAKQLPGASEEEISLIRARKKLPESITSKLSLEDDTYKVEIHYRKEAGDARVTIFEGGHESLPEAAVSWLEGITRPTAWCKQLSKKND